jgi:hypothetical protein
MYCDPDNVEAGKKPCIHANLELEINSEDYPWTIAYFVCTACRQTFSWKWSPELRTEVPGHAIDI